MNKHMIIKSYVFTHVIWEKPGSLSIDLELVADIRGQIEKSPA